MEKSTNALFVDDLKRRDGSLAGDLAGPLVFIEPRASAPVTFRSSKATRAGPPFSRGRAVTAA
eukprot:2292010-Pyramimonas_sp.AAC.1